jgi:heme-degrading monooxygenase HmoA
MHVRMTQSEGITDFDKTAAMLADNVVPALQEQKGFKGLSASANRDTGAVGIISMWDTQADLEASAAAASAQRDDTVAALGGKVTGVRSLELVVVDIGSQPPGPGCVVVITAASMDPATVDQNLEFFKAHVLPGAQQAPSYRALRNMLDRAKGESTVGIVFGDRASAEAWVNQDSARRDMAKAHGVELSVPEIREIIYTS